MWRKLAFLLCIAVCLFSVTSSVADPDYISGNFCTTTVAVNQTAGTTVITGTTGQRIYVCGMVLVSATAQSISVVEGTGTVCATGIAALIGGTTASMALAANGGFSAVADHPWMSTQVNTNNLCILQSGTGNVSGTISYRKVVPWY